MTGSNMWTDGNALAGPFHDVITFDVTAAVGRRMAALDEPSGTNDHGGR
jgi:hypothetical protein